MTKAESILQKQKKLSRYHVEVLPETWNEKLLEISRVSPVRAGKLDIHFDRSPDIFTIPKLTSYFHRPLGFFYDDQLIGFAIASYQKRYIRGVVTDVIYLGSMHVTEKGTGHIFLKKLTERVVQIVQNRSEVKYLYAYVMEGNRPAKRLANLGKLGSKPAGTISMSTIFTLKPVALSNKYSIRKAGLSDVDRIAAMLSNEFRSQFLSPEMSRDIFLRNLELRPGVDIENYYLATLGGEILGLCLPWDMTPFKKNRIRLHGFKMNFLRKFYNTAARLSGSPLLPKSGEAFKDVTIAEYTIKDRNPEIMEALLRYIYNEYRVKGYHSVIFGCSSDDPIIQAAKPFLSREVRSSVIIVPLQKDSTRTFRQMPMVYADTIEI